MSDVLPERINIQISEVAYKAAVSESIMNRVAASINHINYYQHDTKQFFINGKYYVGGASQTGVDGAYMFLFDAEITGIAMFNLIAGASGTTTLDIVRYTASNTGGSSIFTVKPAIASTAGNNAYVGVSLTPSYTILENPSGTTAPTMALTTVSAGDLIKMNVTGVQTGGENAGIVVYFRPV